MSNHKSTVVFVVTDESKECYGAAGIFHSVHSTRESAEARIHGFCVEDRSMFDIQEEVLQC